MRDQVFDSNGSLVATEMIPDSSIDSFHFKF